MKPLRAVPYQLVDGFPDIQRLKTDVFRERVRYAEALKHGLAAARDSNNAAAPQGIETELGALGGVVLFLADIHLHRARLFMRDTYYPWNRHEDGTPRGPADDLAAARRLIETHGYWRRKEELQDAEVAWRLWQTTTPAVGAAP